MKNIIISIGLTLTTVLIYGQTEKLIGTNLKFELPNDKWEQTSRQESNGKTIYYYKREPITDSENRQVIPNISFIVESVPEPTDVIIYSSQKRAARPFEVTEVFSHDSEKSKLNYAYAIGYKGIYKDRSGLEHTIYVIHLINKDKGVQIIFDITTELFEEYENEFLTTMKSLEEK